MALENLSRPSESQRPRLTRLVAQGDHGVHHVSLDINFILYSSLVAYKPSSLPPLIITITTTEYSPLLQGISRLR